MEIYWIENKRQRGPASVPDVLSMIEAGDASWETRGWHRGCTRWMPLRELPALSYYAWRAEQAAGAPQDSEDGAEGSPGDPGLADTGNGAEREGETSGEAAKGALIVPMPSPSLRLLARIADSFLYLTLVIAVLRASGSGFHVVYATPLLWVPMCALEGWLVYRFATTPGKALLGFGVTTFDNRKPALGQSMLRACLVFLFGMGMMYFPILAPLMMGLSWYQVRKRGLSSWDARLMTLPRMRVAEVRPERILLSLMLIFVCLQLTGWMLLGWAPEIQSSMHEAMKDSPPEMHRMIDKMFP